MPPPQAFLAAAGLGTRVVVRYRIEGGMTDALGELVARTDTECTVRTRRTDVVIPLALGGGRQAGPASAAPAGPADRLPGDMPSPDPGHWT